VEGLPDVNLHKNFGFRHHGEGLVDEW
jgi:hypothetical protein